MAEHDRAGRPRGARRRGEGALRDRGAPGSQPPASCPWAPAAPKGELKQRSTARRQTKGGGRQRAGYLLWACSVSCSGCCWTPTSSTAPPRPARSASAAASPCPSSARLPPSTQRAPSLRTDQCGRHGAWEVRGGRGFRVRHRPGRADGDRTAAAAAGLCQSGSAPHHGPGDHYVPPPQTSSTWTPTDPATDRRPPADAAVHR